MNDAPDDFDYSNIGEFTANLDTNELAARLYSPAMYNRVGQLLFATDISKGVSGMEYSETPPDQTVQISTLYASASGLSVAMRSNNTDEDYCYIGNRVPYVGARYYILDMGYYLKNDGAKLKVELYVFANGTRYFGAAKHHIYPPKIEILDSDSLYYDITDRCSTDAIFGAPSHIRMIIDTEYGNYKQLSINGAQFELSDKNVVAGTTLDSNRVNGWASLGYDGGSYGLAYLQWLTMSASDQL